MQEGNDGRCRSRGPQVENTLLAAALCGSALRRPSVGRREKPPNHPSFTPLREGDATLRCDKDDLLSSSPGMTPARGVKRGWRGEGGVVEEVEEGGGMMGRGRGKSR